MKKVEILKEAIMKNEIKIPLEDIDTQFTVEDTLKGDGIKYYKVFDKKERQLVYKIGTR